MIFQSVIEKMTLGDLTFFFFKNRNTALNMNLSSYTGTVFMGGRYRRPPLCADLKDEDLLLFFRLSGSLDPFHFCFPPPSLSTFYYYFFGPSPTLPSFAVVFSDWLTLQSLDLAPVAGGEVFPTLYQWFLRRPLLLGALSVGDMRVGCHDWIPQPFEVEITF